MPMSRAWLEFAGAAFRNPRIVSTPIPTSRALAERLTAPLAHAPAGLVVELGAGAGAITGPLSERARGPVLAVELDPALARFLGGQFPSIRVEQGRAQDLGRWVPGAGVSAVVSSLPWSLMPQRVREEVLDSVVSALAPDGVFSTYMCVHTFLSPGTWSFLGAVRARFGEVEARQVEWRNTPPALVIVARDRKGARAAGQADTR
jgi:phosphatidylethanolamine/phosphatidyl-N-methylethanolamine N-methyltransferase